MAQNNAKLQKIPLGKEIQLGLLDCFPLMRGYDLGTRRLDSQDTLLGSDHMPFSGDCPLREVPLSSTIVPPIFSLITYIYLLTILYRGREVLAREALVEVPQHDDPFLIADQQLVHVCWTQLKTLDQARVTLRGRLNTGERER